MRFILISALKDLRRMPPGATIKFRRECEESDAPAEPVRQIRAAAS